jgi:hypothetical protein
MPDQLAAVLLRRRGLVAVDLLAPDGGGPAPRPPRRRRWRRPKRHDSATVTAVLEVELIHRGYLLSASLYRRCVRLTPDRVSALGAALIEQLDALLGADVEHVPLFQGFPDSVPDDVEELYVDRMFSALLQESAQPCVLCGESGHEAVHPVSPCAHLVCRLCWDGAEYSACPICHQRIDPDDPFLQPTDLAREDKRRPSPPVERLRLLVPADEPLLAAAEVASAMLSRQTPLAAPDLADLTALVDALLAAGGVPGWLPDPIPVRETRAVVLARLLDRFPDVLGRHADTATDVLRVLHVLMDADPGLRAMPPRRRSLPRALRRTVLARLNALPMPALVEDMLRHRAAWKRVAENLHPFEYAARFPVAAVAFAVVRRVDVTGRGAVWQAIRSEAARHPELRLDGGRLRATTFAGRVETALTAGRPAQALDLLRDRPGELMRRVVHLARVLPPDDRPDLVDAVTEVACDVSPSVLVAVLGQLRTPPGGVRLFFPRGGSARVWVTVDDRDGIPSYLVNELVSVLTGELLRRAAALPRVGRAFLDERLDDLVAPGSERNSSATLVRLTRGSTQPVPAGDQLRLFLHWQQPAGTRVDLDLSVAMYDEHWEFCGLCDYTTLRFADDVLVHSGDLTSAPAPLGASEFVDIDTEAVRVAGGRYLLPVVFSYNDVPFDQLERGFAGVMRQPDGLFDPLAVRHRFDLSGPAKILLPFAVDLWSRRLRWYDVNLSAAGYGHNLDKYAVDLARVGLSMEDVYEAADRVSLWELSCWHAAARADEVVVRVSDGSLVCYRRGAADPASFARRVATRQEPDARAEPDAAETADLVAVVTGDVEPAPGAEVFALHPGSLDPNRVTLVDAAHLLSTLTPDARAKLAQP